MTEEPTLEGVLRALPGPRHDLLEVVAAEYAALADRHGPRNVLVLKRHPAGLERVRETLARACATGAGPPVPRVESLPEHASKVLEEYDPTLDRLAYEERIELVSMVIAGAKRDVPPYLERAREHDAFARDVGQLLLEATRQRIRLEDCDPEALHECLAFCYAMNDRFHAVLEDRGLVERADVLPRVVDLLERNADGLRDRVTRSFDAVLAIEFEEFRRLDREYLASLAGDADLVCLGERHASVERVRAEPGSLEDLADGLAVEPASHPDSSEGPPHAAITEFLAAGETDDEGRARLIRARTRREGVREVAAEIGYLLDRHEEWRHDDVAVAVPTVERVPEARAWLRDAGIPTATVGTDALAADPAVNELYAIVSYNRGRDRERALERLEARVPGFEPAVLEACCDGNVRRSLERWIRRTNLKGRIAEGESWVDAAEAFDGVRRVLEIARFVEETDLVGPDWEGMARTLDRTIRYDAPHVHEVETRTPTGGVTVCAVTDLKYDRREAVFVLDCTDDHYPGESHLTRLFPTAWLREMPHYPAVTRPTPEALARTFATAPDPPDLRGDPFEVYHAQRSRRALALGARAAASRLYLCTYEREADGLRRARDRSRYLALLESRPGIDLESVDALARSRAIRGEANALEAILGEPRGELERILREASTGGEADLAETEALFQELAVVLESGIDDDLAEAVRSQFEFAAGEVRRD